MASRHQDPEQIGSMEDESTWTKTIWVPQIPQPLFPDEEGLSEEFAVEKRAIDAGEKGRPLKSDEKPDDTQLRVCNRVFEGILRLNQFLAEQLGVALAAARDRRVQVPQADRVDDQVVLAVESAIGDHRPELARLCYESLSRDRQLRAFARRNGLTRSAEYTETPEFTVAVIFGMVVVESILNGALLQVVMANGLVGGVGLAAMISIINVALGLSAGMYGWRNLKHKQLGNRIVGVSFTGLNLVGLAWNILIGHFRDAAEILSESQSFSYKISEISKATVAHISANGIFGLSSVQAWALLLIGLAIHFYAAKKGWEDIVDKYPDYKKVDVNAKNADVEYTEKLAEVREIARDAVEEIEREANTVSQRSERWLDAVDELIDRAQQRYQEVMGSEDEWVSTGNRLLKLYRDTNVEIRGGAGPPYFRRYPTAQDYRERTFGGVRGSGDVTTQEKLVARTMDAFKALRLEAEEAVKAGSEYKKVVARAVHSAIRGLDDRLKEMDASFSEEARRRLADEAAIDDSRREPLSEVRRSNPEAPDAAPV